MKASFRQGNRTLNSTIHFQPKTVVQERHFPVVWATIRLVALAAAAVVAAAPSDELQGHIQQLKV